MSINKITILMMVFLLVHACSARPLGVLNKDEEKPNVARVSRTPSDVKVKPSSAEPNSLKKNEKDHQLMEGSSSSSNYGASVYWRIHHQKREDPPPEFNLDYLPARTHPPVHN